MNVIKKNGNGRLRSPLKGKIGLSDAPPLSRAHLPYAEALTRRCREFMRPDSQSGQKPRGDKV